MKWIQLLFFAVTVGVLCILFYDYNALNQLLRGNEDSITTLFQLSNDSTRFTLGELQKLLGENKTSMMTVVEFFGIAPQHTAILKTTLTAWFLFTLVHIIVSNQNKNKQRNNNANS